MYHHKKNPIKIDLAQDENIRPGMAFIGGQCQYCGFYPKHTYIKESDTLYHCSRCGYPMEFHALMELIDRFQQEMESDSALCETMLTQKANVIK